MKKIAAIIIALILIFGSCVDAFADAYIDSLKEIDRMLDEGAASFPPEMRNLMRWQNAFLGMGFAPQKRILNDGTISEVFPNPFYSPNSKSGSINGEKFCINWSESEVPFQEAYQTLYNINITGLDGIHISRVEVKCKGTVESDTIITDCGTDVGKAYPAVSTGKKDNGVTVEIKDSGVQDLNFWFRFWKLASGHVESIKVEYRYDYAQYLINQRDAVAQRIADAENDINNINHQKAELDREIKKLEEIITLDKAELEEWNAKIAAEIGAQGTENTTGSVVSGGNPAIVVGIMCFAVGFFLAMIIFRKKQNGKIIN